MLKPYKDLTEAQKKQVAVMYSDLTSQEQYLYNFDENGKYLGRQFNMGTETMRDVRDALANEPPAEDKPGYEYEEPAKPKRKPRAKK